jgi:hypothetical protein
MLTAIGLCGELFYVASGTAFADIVVNGHRETWPIRSKRFRLGCGGAIKFAAAHLPAAHGKFAMGGCGKARGHCGLSAGRPLLGLISCQKLRIDPTL